MDSIRLQSEPLEVAAAVQAVTCPEAGGIDVFLGTTRGEAHPEHGALLALDYEAYEPMALAEMARLVGQARGRWPIARAVVWHRIGRVGVGEPSVVIAVSCLHRGEAFSACQFLIDRLKESVPIWKREIYPDSGRWQAGASPATPPSDPR